MSTRWAVEAKGDDGIWGNIYKDKRTFANERYAKGKAEAFAHFRHFPVRIVEVKVKDDKEKIISLERKLSIYEKIINKMTYGLYVSDPLNVFEEIKQGNFVAPESLVVEFLDLNKIVKGETNED